MARLFLFVPLLIFPLISCTGGIPKDALQLNSRSLAHRQLQTRRFETMDEAMILAASAGLLQDLGFNLDESDTEVGLLVASKDRTARETAQEVAKYTILFLSAVSGSAAVVPTDRNQKMRASVVTRPISEGSIAVRVTFQRVVWNDQNQVTKREGMLDPDAYQKFFSMLSKAVFLEAHEL